MKDVKNLQCGTEPPHRKMMTEQYIGEARRQHGMQDLQDEIKATFRKMTTKQFKDFAFDWFGQHDLSKIIDSDIGKEFDEENLTMWLKMIKARLNM